MYTSLSTGALKISATFADQVRLASAGHFAGLDFSIEEVSALADQDGVEAVRAQLSAAGLRPGSWGLPLPFQMGDDAAMQAALDALPHYAEVAEALGAKRCHTWVLPFSDTLPFAANETRHIERLRPAADILAQHSIRLGLEFIGPATLRRDHAHAFVFAQDGMLALAHQIGPNVGLLLDSYHWYTSHGRVAGLKRLRAQDVVHVHLNDAPVGIPEDSQLDLVRCLPGATGVIDLISFLGVLQAMGYDGPITVEPFDASLHELTPDERVSRAARSLSSVMGASGVL